MGPIPATTGPAYLRCRRHGLGLSDVCRLAGEENRSDGDSDGFTIISLLSRGRYLFWHILSHLRPVYRLSLNSLSSVLQDSSWFQCRIGSRPVGLCAPRFDWIECTAPKPAPGSNYGGVGSRKGMTQAGLDAIGAVFVAPASCIATCTVPTRIPLPE